MNSRMTLFPPTPKKTYKADKTYSIGNNEFLAAVFGGELADKRPVLFGFPNNH